MERITSAEFRRRQGLEPAVATDNRPQIRLPKKRQMNKTEGECMRLLQSLFRASEGYLVLYEPWSFKLPSGCRYTPDFVVMIEDRVLEVTECKGGKVLNGHTIRAFKEARAAFPHLNFKFRQKTKEGWATV
jgi:hypothetical protein